MTKNDDNSMDGIFNLFWSIHMHCVQTANPTEDELKSIRAETRKIFDEVFNANEGVPSTFVACTLQRRPE